MTDLQVQQANEAGARAICKVLCHDPDALDYIMPDGLIYPCWKRHIPEAEAVSHAKDERIIQLGNALLSVAEKLWEVDRQVDRGTHTGKYGFSSCGRCEEGMSSNQNADWLHMPHSRDCIYGIIDRALFDRGDQ